MKVLLINGSPHANGSTYTALKEVADTLNIEGIETEIVQVGHLDIRGCIGCGTCFKTKQCVFNDIVEEMKVKFEECDGLVLGSPVYYSSPNGTLLSLLDRMFYSSMKIDKRMKVGASVVSCRRGGNSSTFDVLNKYFTISGMPLASSQYWNSVHGSLPGQAEQDLEGLQTMRTLARNMSFLMKSIALGKEQFGIPEREKGQYTNFIR